MSKPSREEIDELVRRLQTDNYQLSDIREAGEILVSGTVRDLVIGSELSFADREHELKGIPGRWPLYAAA